MKNKLTALMLLILFVTGMSFAQLNPATGLAPDGLSNQLLTPTLSWSASTGGTAPYSYEVIIKNGVSTIHTSAPQAGLTYTVPAGVLTLYGNTYSWEVKTTDATVPTPLTTTSLPVNFTTYINPTPTPANAAINRSVTTTTQVSWTAINEGNFGNGPYDVEVYIGANDGTSDFSASATANLFFNLTTPLLYNQLYTWRVRDTDIDGANSDGTWHQFTFTTQSIPAPTLTSPANTLTGVTVLPTFNWSWSGSGSVSYKLQVATANTFGGSIIYETTIAGTSQLLPEDFILNNNSNYFWKVIAQQGSNTAESTPWSFKTIPSVTLSPIAPLNGSNNVYFDPTYFSFQIVSGNASNLKFVIQYFAKTSAPTIAEWAGAPTHTVNDLLAELPVPITLVPYTKYYWRIAIKTTTNELVNFTPVYSFTTKRGSQLPYLSFPIGGVPVYTNNPTFYWYIGTSDLTNITFDLLIDDSNDCFSPVVTKPGLTSINHELLTFTLTPNTTYYWKVICYYNGTDPQSSSISSFKTRGSGTVLTPILSWPTGGTEIYTTTPTLYWYLGGSSDGLTFKIEVKNVTDAGPYQTFATGVTNLFLDLSTNTNPFSLVAGKTYEWKVTATNGNAAQDLTSTPTQFKVSSNVGTGSVIASWPIGNPTVYTLKPTLYWYLYGSSTGLTKYVVKYTTTSGLDQAGWTALGGGADVALTSTSYEIPTNLSSNQTYYWAVAGFNGGTKVTDWATGSFTVSSTTTAVSLYLSSPANNSTVYTLTPTLYWYATGAISGITSYTLTYSNTSNFAGGAAPAFVTLVSGLTDNFYTLPSNAALAGATIYWKVTANHTGGPTTSSTGYFVIDPGSSVIVPMAGSPINNIELKTNAATLSWFTPTQSKSKLTYNVELAENSNFTNAKVITGLTEPKTSVGSLKANTKYFWRTKSISQTGILSNYSEPATFRISGSPTGVETKDVVPSEFSLEQNYPNPFNPETVISYKVKAASHVTLKVYDVLGNEIATLVNELKQPGEYNYQFSTLNYQLSSGVYFYRLNAEGNTLVKKMMLMK